MTDDDDDLEYIDRGIDRYHIMNELDAWLAGGLKIERAEGSAMHRLNHDLQTGNMINLHARGVASMRGDITRSINTFVIQHDWAAAFTGAKDFNEGDFRFPYDECCFEFRISGKRVCAMVTEKPGEKVLMPVVETKIAWAIPQHAYVMRDGRWEEMHASDDDKDEFVALKIILLNQVRAVCVALEAEVADTDQIAAPEKMNAARVRRGQSPLPEYRVVRLNRRPRSITAAGEPGSKKRLHFRRGHWRHYEDHKTWIKWMLVGDPELGFLDKEYRL